jgi:hypothetical protein
MSHIDSSIKKAIAKQGKYWIGPANIRVPWTVTSVPQLDEVNKINMHLNKNGEYYLYATQIFVIGGKRLSQNEYRKQYARLGEDGLWYWKE